MNRVNIIRIIVLIIGLVLIGKLFHLQVIDDEYALRAENISKRVLTIKPHRGIIKDRKGEIIVQNGSSYNLVLNIPYDTSEMDVEHFCTLVDLIKSGV
jgi:penicillin-binding protein 2